MATLRYRAIFLSDIHLGTRDAHAEYLLDFLRHVEAEHIYLVGDILDLWKMKSGWYWPQINNTLLQLLLEKGRRGTKIIYIPGNHDELLRDYVGTEFNGIHIEADYIHTTSTGRRFLLLHGDEFDSVVLNNKWLSHLGTWAYDWLLILNRHFNRARRRFGFPYWSLSAYLKHKVKNAVMHISSFETAVTLEATRRNVQGVICGHIHKATVATHGEIIYANCGDWVESCTALVEDYSGEISLLHWVSESAMLLDAAALSEQALPHGASKAA